MDKVMPELAKVAQCKRSSSTVQALLRVSPNLAVCPFGDGQLSMPTGNLVHATAWNSAIFFLLLH